MTVRTAFEFNVFNERTLSFGKCTTQYYLSGKYLNMRMLVKVSRDGKNHFLVVSRSKSSDKRAPTTKLCPANWLRHKEWGYDRSTPRPLSQSGFRTGFVWLKYFCPSSTYTFYNKLTPVAAVLFAVCHCLSTEYSYLSSFDSRFS